MKFIKIGIFLLCSGILFARPWEKFLSTDTVSVEVKPLNYFELSNKIKVYYIKNTILPKVTFQLIIDGGGSEENLSNAGITSVWGSSVVFSGSKDYPRKKLSEILELHGTEFNFTATLERSLFSVDSLSDFFEQDLVMVADVLKNPLFDKSDVDLIKSQNLQSIKKRKENPAQMANIAAQLIHWQNNVRGNITTKKSIESINEANLKNWHQQMMDASRFTILLTGDIDPDAMKKMLEKHFQSFKKSTKGFSQENLLVSPEMEKKGMQIIYHQIMDIPQTTILLRAPGIKHNDPDYYAVKLFDFLLGGDSFNSYLTNVIRVKNGWAYSVYSRNTSTAYTGNMAIFVQTQNKNVPNVLEEIDRVLKNPELIISDDRLSAAKNSIKNSLVFMAETPETLARLQLSLKWDNLPDDYLTHYLENIQKVTSNDLRRVARKYYSPESFFASIVGPKDVINDSESEKKNISKRIRKIYSLPE